jgi:hypothetical protein
MKQPTVNDGISAQVSQLLNQGQNHPQPNRADNPDLNCFDIAPGNTSPTPGQKAAVVTISPNSPGLSSETINDPAVITVGTTVEPLFKANPNRQEFLVQNIDTVVVYLIFTKNKGSNVVYHVALSGCTAADDGTGGSYISDLWKGDVYIVGQAAAARVVAYEMTP